MGCHPSWTWSTVGSGSRGGGGGSAGNGGSDALSSIPLCIAIGPLLSPSLLLGDSESCASWGECSLLPWLAEVSDSPSSWTSGFLSSFCSDRTLKSPSFDEPPMLLTIDAPPFSSPDESMRIVDYPVTVRGWDCPQWKRSMILDHSCVGSDCGISAVPENSDNLRRRESGLVHVNKGFEIIWLSLTPVRQQ